MNRKLVTVSWGSCNFHVTRRPVLIDTEDGMNK